MDVDLYWESLIRLFGFKQDGFGDWVFTGQGLIVVFETVFLSLAIGFVLALGIAFMRVSKNIVLRGFGTFYVSLFRGTPLLIQMFLIYYGLGQFEFVRESWAWTFLKDAYFCAILGLSLNTAAYGGEIIRGGLQSVPFGQIEAAKSLGMSRSKIFRRITFPIAMRQALPGYGNEIVLMVSATSIASTITIMDLTGVAGKIGAETFDKISPLLAAATLYLIINIILTQLVKRLEHRLSGHLRRAEISKTAVQTPILAR